MTDYTDRDDLVEHFRRLPVSVRSSLFNIIDAVIGLDAEEKKTMMRQLDSLARLTKDKADNEEPGTVGWDRLARMLKANRRLVQHAGHAAEGRDPWGEVSAEDNTPPEPT